MKKEKSLETPEERLARLATEKVDILLENSSDFVMKEMNFEVNEVARKKDNLIEHIFVEAFLSTIHKECGEPLREALEVFFTETSLTMINRDSAFKKIRTLVNVDLSSMNDENSLFESYADAVRTSIETPVYVNFLKECVEATNEEKGEETTIEESFKSLIESFSEIGIVGETATSQAVVCSTMAGLTPKLVKGYKEFFKSEAHINQFLEKYSEILENPFA